MWTGGRTSGLRLVGRVGEQVTPWTGVDHQGGLVLFAPPPLSLFLSLLPRPTAPADPVHSIVYADRLAKTATAVAAHIRALAALPEPGGAGTGGPGALAASLLFYCKV